MHLRAKRVRIPRPCDALRTTSTCASKAPLSNCSSWCSIPAVVSLTRQARDMVEWRGGAWQRAEGFGGRAVRSEGEDRRGGRCAHLLHRRCGVESLTQRLALMRDDKPVCGYASMSACVVCICGGEVKLATGMYACMLSWATTDPASVRP